MEQEIAKSTSMQPPKLTGRSKRAVTAIIGAKQLKIAGKSSLSSFSLLIGFFFLEK